MSSGVMDAVIFRGLKEVSVDQVAVPQLEGPNEALVQVRLAGLCGSDMHLYCCREQGLDVGTIMGHEFVGTVIEVGSGVKKIRVGQRVVSAFTSCCGECWFCTHDLPSRCSHPQGAACYGWVSKGAGIQGGQAEVVRVPLADGTLVPVPQNVSDEEALLCGDVLATAFYCVDRSRLALLANKQESVTAVVVGCGPVGLLAILGARLSGASLVWAVDSVPERLTMAEKFGARPLSNSEGGIVQNVMESTEGRGADVVLEAVGSQSAIQLAYDLVRPGGTISSVGVHTATEWGFTPIQVDQPRCI
eukprot:jgi/Botrbrau1/3823/Bobra.0183s0052.2